MALKATPQRSAGFMQFARHYLAKRTLFREA